jgi:tetratricopeptide (TPR) repeat protein
MQPFLLLCLFLTLFTFQALPVPGQNPPPAAADPQQLQQQAIARIEEFREHFNKTGDYSSQSPELEKADQELKVSADLFIKAGDKANAALSQLRRGDALRMLSLWEEAAGNYQEALKTAQQAGNVTYQVKALIGLARTDSWVSNFLIRPFGIFRRQLS